MKKASLLFFKPSGRALKESLTDNGVACVKEELESPDGYLIIQCTCWSAFYAHWAREIKLVKAGRLKRGKVVLFKEFVKLMMWVSYGWHECQRRCPGFATSTSKGEWGRWQEKVWASPTSGNYAVRGHLPHSWPFQRTNLFSWGTTFHSWQTEGIGRDRSGLMRETTARRELWQYSLPHPSPNTWQGRDLKEGRGQDENEEAKSSLPQVLKWMQ